MKYLERKEFSKEKLNELHKEINKKRELNDQETLCIYATGSYARLEASDKSDLDLFFISKGKFPKIEKTLIDACLIKLTRDMGISDFSGDGRYLQIHDINSMTKELGGQSDDYKNYFTARLLLLLESHPICNQALYDEFIYEIIDSYYKDFEDHESDFKPFFLINDIIRYWKTITLNYENNRIGDKDPEKMRVKNFKLKFSRKLMCFSFIIKLLSLEGTVRRENVFDIVKQTPIERFKSLGGEGVQSMVEKMLNLYDWFLEKTAVEKDEITKWFDDQNNRIDSLKRSQEFGDSIFEILVNVDKNKYLKYLVI